MARVGINYSLTSFLLICLLVFTLFRVFTDRESPNAYEFIFSRVFYLVQKVTNEAVRFHYLHNKGFKAIVTDMCPNQMTGIVYYFILLFFN